MSVTIEKLRTDVRDFNVLKDQFLTQYHQTCGAISVLEQQLKLLITEEELEKEKEQQKNKAQTEVSNDEHSDPKLNKIINDVIDKQNTEKVKSGKKSKKESVATVAD